jgi:hypothetical protein
MAPHIWSTYWLDLEQKVVLSRKYDEVSVLLDRLSEFRPTL